MTASVMSVGGVRPRPVLVDDPTHNGPRAELPLKPLSGRVGHFTESVIREMTRLANRYGAINLSQGMPDFDPPGEVLDAAAKALRDGHNQYAITWGAPALRAAIADKARRFNGIDADPDRHVTVCCGATEAMMAAMLALIEPGDEVVILQPFYENYGPDSLISGARPVWVALQPPEWRLDLDALAAAFSPRTKAIILNTPNNPTGRVLSLRELSVVAELCQAHNAYAITDEIYEHIIYTEAPHISLATLPGMAERTVTISGLSKTFSVTGWRLGYVLAPEGITTAIRKVHDFLTVGAPHPLQMAGAAALALPPSYYEGLTAAYRRRRDILCGDLTRAGLAFTPPQGAYYVMCDIRPLARWGAANDVEFVGRLIREIGVAAVPGSSFHSPAQAGSHWVRFMFAKRDETLRAAGERLAKLRQWL